MQWLEFQALVQCVCDDILAKQVVFFSFLKLVFVSKLFQTLQCEAVSSVSSAEQSCGTQRPLCLCGGKAGRRLSFPWTDGNPTGARSK